MYWCAPDDVVRAEIRTAAEAMSAVLPPGKVDFDWIDGHPLGVRKRLAAYNRSRLEFGFDCVGKAALEDDLFTDEVCEEDILEASLTYLITYFTCSLIC